MSVKQGRTAQRKSFVELSALGFFLKHSLAMQIDLNVAWHKEAPPPSLSNASAGQRALLPLREGHLCDHNCTLHSETNPLGGGYACPAAFTLPANRHLDPKSLVSTEDILSGIQVASAGLQSIHPQFLQRLHVTGYPQEIVEGIAASPSLPEINLFGGNPEMHPHIHEIIAQLVRTGYPVTLTTTGKRFLTSPTFVSQLMDHPPTKIALSADDLPTDTAELRRLTTLSQTDLRAEYKKIPPAAGQKQKAVEAISVLNLSRQYANFPPIILNYVLHAGNIEMAMDILQLLGELYPHARLNPYPAQSAFSGDPVVLGTDQLGIFERIIDDLIEKHFAQLTGPVDFLVVPRLHYYLFLKAVFLAYPDDLKKVNEVLAGYGLWRCYEDPLLTGRYLQIGGGGEQLAYVAGEKRPSPGGHPGCFWNQETVTNAKITVWNSTPEQVKQHIIVGMQQLAEQSEHPCPGCGFPRLVFDEPSVVGGLPRTATYQPILSAYLLLRSHYAGF